MDTRNKRPVRTAVSLGLGAALVATAGVVAVTPVVTALASQGTVAKPAAARPGPAALNATVVRTALPAAANPQGYVQGVSCGGGGCTLSAMEGTVDVKSAVTPQTPSGTKTLHVWKFADTTGAAAPAAGASSAGAGSAVLEGTVGVAMTIRIHNTLGLPVGLSIPQLDGANLADVAPATDTADAVYTFTPRRAGTYVYQAGLTENGSRQTAMGLVGALVVRPSADLSTGISEPAGVDAAPHANAVAYDAKESKAAYADEAVLVYTDVDSAMTSDPIGFNMRTYRADYHLINGKAYPDVPAIGTAPGNAVMLRVVNGAILEKSPTILGTRLDEFAVGTRPLPTPLSVSGRLVQTGDTFDALLAMPATDKVRYAIYDAPGTLRNGDEVNLAASAAKNAPALGGGVVLIDSGFVDGTLVGAAVTKLAAAGQPGSAGSPLTVTADLASRDGGDVTKAELYVDSLAGTPVPITVSGCGASCSVTVTLDGTVLGGLTSGMHPMWVRAQTANSAWGPYALIKVRIDNDGPAVTQLTLSNAVTNATTDLDVTATLDERTTGGSMVTGASYWIISTQTNTKVLEGNLNVNGPRLIASGDVTIPALVPDPANPNALMPSDFAKLPEGNYQFFVQGWDELGPGGKGNLGKAVSTPLVIDKTAPVTDSITLDPTASNGLQGSATKPDSIRITATVHDELSAVTAVDGYLDSVRPAGNANGIYFSKVSGTTWTADMPLSWLAGKKADGQVSFFVVGTDAAGNRGDGSTPATPVTLTIDRTPGATSIASTALQRVGNRAAILFTATAADSGTGVSYVEYFLGTDPGRGNGVPISGAFIPAVSPTAPVVGTTTVTDATTRTVRAINVTFTSRNAGYVPFTVRSRDLAGNWTQQTVNVPITRAQLFGNGFDAPAGLRAAAATAWNVAPSGRTAIVAAGRIAGQRSLSVATGVVGYYTENVAKLDVASSDDLHLGFLMAPKRATTGCATAGGAARCAPNGVTVFSGTTSKGATAVAVQYGRATATSRVQFRLGVMRSTGAIAWGAWTTVKAATTYDVRVDWASDAAGAGILRVNSTKPLSRVSVSNATVHVTAVHVGVINRVAKARGSILFDTFSIA